MVPSAVCWPRRVHLLARPQAGGRQLSPPLIATLGRANWPARRAISAAISSLIMAKSRQLAAGSGGSQVRQLARLAPLEWQAGKLASWPS